MAAAWCWTACWAAAPPSRYASQPIACCADRGRAEMSDVADDDELDAELPLAGIRVLDVSSFIAAPAAAVTLGDWGADVIKVEPPGTGDPHRDSWKGANYPQAAANFPWQLDSRNKRSIVLDLKQPAARAALDKLIARA